MTTSILPHQTAEGPQDRAAWRQLLATAPRSTDSVGRATILADLSLAIEAGHRTAIIGPNGAGKSTLLRLLAGLAQPAAGQVLLAGRDIRQFKRQALARRLAVLPQGVEAPADMTVRRLIDCGRFPYRSYFRAEDPKKDREAVDWAMEVTHVADLQGREVQLLSGGERQRAFLAMVLAQQPEVLLLDEPTTYLDMAHQLEVMQIIAAVNRQYGMTVVMVLHDINHALQYADAVAVLRDHHIVRQGSPKDVISAELLADVFGVEADSFTNRQGRTVLSPVALVRR